MVSRGSIVLLVALAACSGSATVADGDAGADGGIATDAPQTGPDGAPSPQGSSDYIFADDQLRTFELTIAPDDWQWLQDHAQAEQYVQGVLTFEGYDYGPIGVRFKGGFGNLHSCFDSFGVNQCKKLSMKLKFNEYDPDGRFFELKKLNFHSMKSDPSALHDRLAYSLFRDMGVPAPRANHALLAVNGTPLGLFALIEQVDGRFTRMNYPDGGEGNLYKEIWPVHDTPAPYLSALKTNEDQSPDVSKMVAFASALTTATDETIETVISQWTDIDTLMAFLAVDRAVENWDGIVGWWCINGNCSNHNFYWYEETTADKMWLVPWDMDHTFEYPNSFHALGQLPWDEVTEDCTPVTIFEIQGATVGRAPASCDPLIRWLATTLRPRYIAASQTLLDGPFQAAAIKAKLDRWQAQIADAVAADPNGPTVENWEFSVGVLRDNVDSLRADIEAVVAP